MLILPIWESISGYLSSLDNIDKESRLSPPKIRENYERQPLTDFWRHQNDTYNSHNQKPT